MTPFGPLSTTRYVVNGVPFDTVRVPPGRFVDGEGMEKRELINSRPFELGVTLVTQALWRAVTRASPSRRRGGGDLPVEQVSWYDVQDFLTQLEALGLHGFRLPTEAEWVWAARCGVATLSAGADRVGVVAVVNQQRTAPVGGLSSSVAGALDLSGNVWEWQQDQWSDLPVAGVDAQGPASGSGRVARGGSWINNPRYARVPVRDDSAPDLRDRDLGLRLARTAP
jgi:formylglycine-generating enzyme required for sulfatase activity